MKYKIFNSSINYMDNKFYTYKNDLDYIKISKRLFNNKINFNKIYFIIKYDDNKLIGFVTKKNKSNIINTKQISLYNKNIQKLLYKNGGNFKKPIDISLLYPFEGVSIGQPKEIGFGSEGIVFKEPYTPFISTGITFETELLAILNPNNNSLINDICNNYLVYEDKLDIDEYVGKICFPVSDITNSICGNLIQDIKIKLLKNKLQKPADRDFFAVDLYKITLLMYDDFRKELPINIKPFKKDDKEEDFCIQYILNDCGTPFEDQLIAFKDNSKNLILLPMDFYLLLKNLIFNIKTLNEFEIIHLDVRLPNILLKNKNLKLIDFGISCNKNNLHNTIFKLFSNAIGLFPFEYMINYFIKTISFDINNLSDIQIIEYKKQYIQNDFNRLKLWKGIMKKILATYIIYFGINIKDLVSKEYTPPSRSIEDILGFYYDEIIKGYIIKITDYIETRNKTDNPFNKEDLFDIVFGEKYYLKVDVFYIGLIMSRINKYFSNEVPLFDKELIKSCISINDPTNRITIVELFDNLEKECRVEYTSNIHKFIYSLDSNGNPLFGKVTGGYKRKIKKYIKKKGGLSLTSEAKEIKDKIEIINTETEKIIKNFDEQLKDKIEIINTETEKIINNLEKQLKDEIEKEIKYEIEKQLNDEIEEQLNDEIEKQLNDEIEKQLNDIQKIKDKIKKEIIGDNINEEEAEIKFKDKIDEIEEIEAKIKFKDKIDEKKVIQNFLEIIKLRNNSIDESKQIIDNIKDISSLYLIIKLNKETKYKYNVYNRKFDKEKDVKDYHNFIKKFLV